MTNVLIGAAYLLRFHYYPRFGIIVIVWVGSHAIAHNPIHEPFRVIYNYLVFTFGTIIYSFNFHYSHTPNTRGAMDTIWSKVKRFPLSSIARSSFTWSKRRNTSIYRLFSSISARTYFPTQSSHSSEYILLSFLIVDVYDLGGGRVMWPEWLRSSHSTQLHHPPVEAFQPWPPRILQGYILNNALFGGLYCYNLWPCLRWRSRQPVTNNGSLAILAIDYI